MRYSVTAAALLLLCANQARAQLSLPPLKTKPDENMLTFGVGSFSCAAWQQNATVEYGGEQWIFGFWSGANEFYGGTVGHSTDQPGIIGEIKKVCTEQPSMQLQDAAGTVFFRFARAGR